MIDTLLIGQEEEINGYSDIINSIKYFGETKILKIGCGKLSTINPDELGSFHAYLIVSPLSEPYELFEWLIRKKDNIYFTDQPNFTEEELRKLEWLQQESGTILQPSVPEIFHPLMEEFISTQGHHLFFRYNKSVPTKRFVRPAILSALSFLSLLSSMPVKKMDVNTIDSTKNNRPHIKIRLKLYDSSISYIIIRIESVKEHHILIESNDGNFTFNFTGNYLENIHGAKFLCDPVSDNDLLKKSLESFALSIIMNKKPAFSFNHYLLAFSVLSKIQNF